MIFYNIVKIYKDLAERIRIEYKKLIELSAIPEEIANNMKN